MENNSVLVAQLGARMHYAVPVIFNGLGCLNKLCTDLYAKKNIEYIVGCLSGNRFPAMKRLMGRKANGLPEDKIKHSLIFGLYNAFKRAGLNNYDDVIRNQIWAGQQLSSISMKSITNDCKVIYSFNTECLELFEFAKEKEIRLIVEQANAPKELIYRYRKEESDLHPGWEDVNWPKDNSLSEIIMREKREWELSDLIICGSDFVKQGIAEVGGPFEKCMVVPYGVKMLPRRRDQKLRIKRRKLNVLTVGSVDLRKGAQYTLKAAKVLNDKVNFRFVGVNSFNKSVMLDYMDFVDFAGPVPRNKIIEQYEWADIFLLPSVCEGSATVIYEALSFGLPVITTENSGSVIRNEIEGLVIPIRSHNSIIDAIERLSDDSIFYNSCSRNALIRSEFCTVDSYSTRLVKAIEY